MASLGLGLGSFLTGLTGGMQIRHQWDQQDKENARADERLKLAQNEDTRAAKSADLQNQQTQFNIDAAKANKPLVDAQRQSALTSLQDSDAARKTALDLAAQGGQEYEQERQKAVTQGVGADGKPVWTVGGKQYADQDEANSAFEALNGDKNDYILKKQVDGMERFHQSRGDMAKATQWRTFADSADVKQAQKDLGTAFTKMDIGDMDGAVPLINKVLSNNGYISQSHHSGKVTKGDDGTYQLEYTDKTTGQKFVHKSKDIAEIKSFLMQNVSPQAAFDQAGKDYAAVQAAAAEKSKAQTDAAKQITVENAKSQNKRDEDQLQSSLRIAEDFAKNQGYQNPKEFANSTRDMLKNMADNGMLRTQATDANGKPVMDGDGKPKMRDMTANEAVTAAANLVHQTNQQARSQGAPAAQQPQTPTLQPQQRSIMSQPQSAPQIQLPPQRRLGYPLPQ